LLLAGSPALADPAVLLAGYRAGSQPDSVEAVVERLLPAAEAASDSARLQILLLERGKTRVAYGRAAEGEPDLREAWGIAQARGDDAAARDALRYLSEACRQTGRLSESSALLDELERRAMAAADSFHAGKALYGLGRLRFGARDRAAAESLFAAAVPFVAAAGDSAGLAALYNSLGNCRGARGAYRDAGAYYARAADLARAGQSRSLEAMARNNLAGVAMIIGDPSAAVEEYRRARDIQIERGLWHQAGAPWRNLAQALTDLGRLDEAGEELTAALVSVREQGHPEEASLTLVRLAALELARGDPGSALARSREAMALGGAASGDTRLTARLRAADALLQLGRDQEAEAELDSAAAGIADSDDYTLAMLLAQSRGRALRAAGRHVEAIATLRRAIGRSTAAGIPRHSMPLLVTAAASWYELGEADSALVCLDQAERVWEQDRALPADPVWRERRGIEAQQLFALRMDLAMRARDLDQGFAALQRFKARTLLERILGPGELPEPEAVPEPVTLERIQREILRPGELLLDMLSGPSGGWLFAVTPDTSLAWPLAGEDAWKEILDPLFTQVAHPFGDFDERTAEAVFEALLGGLPAHSSAADVQASRAARELISSARTILASPDGELHRIPFAAVLPVQDIRRLPSASILAHLRGQAAAAREGPAREGPAREGAGQDGPGREGPGQDGAGQDGPAREGPAWEGPARILAVAGLENAAHARLAGAAAEVRRLRKRFRHVTLAGGADPGDRGLAEGRDVTAGVDPGGRTFAGVDPAGVGPRGPGLPW